MLFDPRRIRVVHSDTAGWVSCTKFYDKDDILRIIEWSDGMSVYYNTKLEKHRVDGPAITYPSGLQEWWLNGEMKSQKEFEQLMKMKAFW